MFEELMSSELDHEGPFMSENEKVGKKVHISGSKLLTGEPLRRPTGEPLRLLFVSPVTLSSSPSNVFCTISPFK